jgi:hypothetical protein
MRVWTGGGPCICGHRALAPVSMRSPTAWPSALNMDNLGNVPIVRSSFSRRLPSVPGEDPIRDHGAASSGLDDVLDVSAIATDQSEPR